MAKTWTLLAEPVKNGEAHIVPLTNLAIEQPKPMQPKASGLVFTTTGKTAVSGFSKAKRTLDTGMIAVITEHQQTGTGRVTVVSITSAARGQGLQAFTTGISMNRRNELHLMLGISDRESLSMRAERLDLADSMLIEC